MEGAFARSLATGIHRLDYVVGIWEVLGGIAGG